MEIFQLKQPFKAGFSSGGKKHVDVWRYRSVYAQRETVKEKKTGGGRGLLPTDAVQTRDTALQERNASRDSQSQC